MTATRRPAAAEVLLLLGIALYLTVSAPLLTVLGIPYDAPYGSFVFKLHPGTYVLLAGMALLWGREGNPLRGFAGAVAGRKLLGFHVATTALLLVYSVLRHGPSGSAFIIESLMMAPLCALAVARLEPAGRRRMLALVVGVVVLNSLLALGEALTHGRLVPHTVAGGIAIPHEHFRATALMGHPLANALVTAPLAVLVVGLPMGIVARAVMAGVMLLALLAFGGRTAFAITVPVLAALVLARAVVDVTRGRWSYARIMGTGALAMMVLAGGAAGVAASGLGERIFAGLHWDDSAHVRLQVWNAFDYLSEWDLALGISPEEIGQVIYRLGLRYPLETIENFWLLMLMQFGVVGMVPFVTGLAAGALHLWRHGAAPARLALLVFLAVASSNNSLASKSPALTLLFTTLAAAAAVRPRPGPG